MKEHAMRILAVLLALMWICGWCHSATAANSSPADYAVHGVVVTDSGAHPGWVTIKGEKIADVIPDASQPPRARKTVRFDGYIYPGFIDTHNHVPWNCMPRWTSIDRYINRYAWQNDPSYLADASMPYYNRLSSTHPEAALCFGELRAVAGGTTLIQSSYDKNIHPDLLIRQLGRSYRADSWVADIRKLPEVSDTGLSRTELLGKLNSGELDRVFFHIAEGRHDDRTSQQEFSVLQEKGFVRSGVVVIHGIALSDADFKTIKENGMYLVWSPRSNMTLYGQTLDIASALKSGVPVALSPDWTLSGSSNILDELRFATAYAKANGLQEILTPKKLFEMVTTDAALVAGVQKSLGAIKPDYGADLVLVKKLNDDAYANITQACTNDVSLVFVKGRPVYGDPQLLVRLSKKTTPIQVGDTNKAAGPINESPTGMPFSSMLDQLHGALPHLAPVEEW